MPAKRFENLEFNFGAPDASPLPLPSLTGGSWSGPDRPAVPARREKLDAPPEPAPPRGPELTDTSAEPVAARVLSVTQLTRRVRQLLEQKLGAVSVEGEISNLRQQTNGHAYFTLKDEGAQLSCVLFRGMRHAGMPALADGLKVQALGEITVYEPRGQYQMIVRDVQAAGLGALQLKFEALKRKLAAEGLFEAARKRALPAFPHCVGVVTSPHGAALRDMLHILRRRAPWVRVVIAPARVQGEGAAAEVARAIATLNATRMRPDLIVIARGGGSIEDLWAFNEEVVARAIVASALPVVSAVGHEIDFTIADFAADVRAPTPSAAAEIIVPDGPALLQRVQQFRALLDGRVQRRLDGMRQVMDWHRRGGLAREPRRLLGQAEQQVDQLTGEVQGLTRERLAHARHRLGDLAHRLERHRPERHMAELQQRFDRLSARLHAASARRLTAAEAEWTRLRAVMKTLGPDQVLARGFSFTAGPDGRPLERADQVKKGDRLRTRLADGEITSVVE